MSMMSIQNAISEINAEKVFATSHATSNVTYVFDLGAIQDPLAPTGKFLINPEGRTQPMLILQCDQDFAYKFSTVSNDTVTVGTGVLVTANQQEYVRPMAQTGRRYLCVIQSTSAGTLKVFRSASAGQ